MMRNDASLAEGDERVEGGRAGFVLGASQPRLEAGAPIDDGGDVRLGGAAAAADDADAVLGDEPRVVLGEVGRGESVVHLPVPDLGEPCVGDHRDREAAPPGEVAEVLVHLVGTGRAVEPDDVGAERFDGGEGGADLGAGEHPPGLLDRHLDLERHPPPGALHGGAAGGNGRLDREQVVHRLDDEEVGASLEETGGERLVCLPQVAVADLTEGRQLRTGPDRAGDEAGPVRCRELAGDVGGDRRRGDGELVGAVLDAVLGEGHGEAAEGVRLHDVGAHLEVSGMEGRDHVGSRRVQDLVTSVERRPAEVVLAEVGTLERGPGGAVEDDDALSQRVEEVSHPGTPGGNSRRRRCRVNSCPSCRPLVALHAAHRSRRSRVNSCPSCRPLVALHALCERRERRSVAGDSSIRHWHRYDRSPVAAASQGLSLRRSR